MSEADAEQVNRLLQRHMAALQRHMAAHNFGGKKGFGLKTYKDIKKGQTLFVIRFVRVSEDDVPKFYEPDCVITNDKMLFIDPKWTGEYDRPIWSYMNSADKKGSENVRTLLRRDEKNNLESVVFETCEDVPAGTELLLHYCYK
jgi:hypothetical protein